MMISPLVNSATTKCSFRIDDNFYFPIIIDSFFIEGTASDDNHEEGLTSYKFMHV